MAKPWNDWYHVNVNTYGTWLRGSPLGFRERHHREHVEGDYKNPPPPDKYAALWAQSKRLMKRRAVYLRPEAADPSRRLLWDSLISDGIEVVCLCIDCRHFHLLARFPDRRPRLWVGRAKGRCARALSKEGLLPEGGVGAKRGRCLPVRDRRHQIATVGYILRHHRHGALTALVRPDRPHAPMMPTA